MNTVFLDSTSINEQISLLKARHKITQIITVFGTSVADFSDMQQYDVSPELILELEEITARPNVAVMNGGYLGTMGSLARSVNRRGGKSFGVVSKTINETVEYDHFTEVMVLNDHWERLTMLVEGCDIFIVLPGGVGTLTEVAAALWVMDRGFSSRRSLIFIGNYWQAVVDGFFSLPLAFRAQKNIDIQFINTGEELSEAFKRHQPVF